MADNLPSSSEKTVVVNDPQLGRLRTLTILSLSLNALILFLIVVGCIIHHHREKEMRGFGGRGGFGGGSSFGGQCHMGGWGHRFHRFGGMGWNRGGNFGGGRGWGSGGPGMGNRPSFGGGPGDNDNARGGFGRGPGGPGGPGFFGGGPGGKNGPPDPAKMTDGILAMLTNKLSLTDDEKTKVKPIIQDQVTQLQAQMEAQRAAMQKQIEDAKAKIKPLLTPDQQKQLDALPLPGQKPGDPPKPEDKPDQ
jgi:hypothetical protein